MTTNHERQGRVDGQTTYDGNTVLCTPVHLAVKTSLSN